MGKTPDEIHNVLLYEVRENRKEIRKLREDLSGVKAKVLAISLFIGMVGGKVATFLPFLK